MPIKKARKRSLAKKIKKKPKITGDILIVDLVSKHPEVSGVLMKYGFHCIGCIMSPYETLEIGAKVHRIPLEPLLRDINKVIN